MKEVSYMCLRVVNCSDCVKLFQDGKELSVYPKHGSLDMVHSSLIYRLCSFYEAGCEIVFETEGAQLSFFERR